MNKIIINGRACSGKDEIADYLVDYHDYVKITFATPIYAIAHRYFGMTGKDRELLQKIGQKMREIDPDVWIKAAFKEASYYDKVVISDCRQWNEYIYAQKNGFFPLRVTSDINTRINRCIERDGIQPIIEQWENESETGADNFEYTTITNDGTKEELYEKIKQLISQGE